MTNSRKAACSASRPLAGRIGTKSMIVLAVRMSRAVDGVVDVVEQLAYTVDDSRVTPRG